MPRQPMREEITPLYRKIVAVARPLLRKTTRQVWVGGEHVPRTGGFVVSSNHVSYFDPLVLGHFLVDHGRAPHYLTKNSLFDYPGLKHILTGTNQIPVYRNTARAVDSLGPAMAAIRLGHCISVLPEGTLTRDPGLWPMTGKSGAARLALETGCLLLPVAMWGPQEVLYPYRGKVPKLLPIKTMYVSAGPPVDLDDLRDQPINGAVLREATDRLMAAITAQLEEIRHEQAPAERFVFRRDNKGKGSS